MAISESVSAAITSRLRRTRGWDVVEPPQEPLTDGALPAEVLVTVGTMPAGHDSATVRIAVRNTAPGSSFGYNVVASQPFAVSANPQGYSGTVREALSILETLRHVERGQDWNLDLGRIRVFSPEQRRQFDSLRKLRVPDVPKPPEP